VASEAAVDRSLAADCGRLRTRGDLTAERARIAVDLERPPDKPLAFHSLMPLLYGDGAQDETATRWTCPMHPEIVRDEPGVCPICGMKLVPVVEPAPTAWTCPMHPEIVRTEPGTCP